MLEQIFQTLVCMIYLMKNGAVFFAFTQAANPTLRLREAAKNVEETHCLSARGLPCLKNNFRHSEVGLVYTLSF